MKSELLSVRALNQYRRRDILAYIGLRYYLENQSARSDRWATEISAHLVNTRESPAYFRSYHYKETGEEDSIIYRSIYVPDPNEALAESALLQECSLSSSFISSQSVYSYHFPKPGSKEGVFRSYFPGFRQRHNSIAEVCKGLNGATVRYTDIKKFYPSISKELALAKWRTACDSSAISSGSRELGERLLIEHNKTVTADGEGSGVLIGPMFSHLIANLVLDEVDKIMSEKMNQKYWRYVDDIVLVGDDKQIEDGRDLLSSILNSIGLSLHTDGKDFAVDSATWLEGEKDFDDSGGKIWMGLIANIKLFLVAKSEERVDLAKGFSENGINIPLLDYSNVATESSYLQRMFDWFTIYPSSRKSTRTLTAKGLIEDAIKAREIFNNRINQLLENKVEITGYSRKRLIPKLRYYAGRLTFLATQDMLSNISAALRTYPELLLQSIVMNTIQSRDVSALLRFGTNAVQAAAQILRIQNDVVRCSLASFGEVELQGLAILRLNGIEIEFTNEKRSETTTDPLNQFATGNNPKELMKSQNSLVKELSCLEELKKL